MAAKQSFAAVTDRGRVAPDLPRQLYIEVTNHCNSLCKSCPLTYDHFLPLEPKHHLTWDQFRRVVDPLPRIDRVVLHGIGEPLMNPQLPRFIAHLKERGAETLFNTNAVLLDERRGDAIVAAGLDQLRISLDAISAPLYAELRGIDKLPRILGNIKAYIARRRARAELEGKQPAVSLWFVGMRENLPELPGVVRWAIEAGVPAVHLQRLVYFGDGSKLDEAATAVAGQSLHETLEALQARVIAECEALAEANGITFTASGATTPGESLQVHGAHPWQGCQRPWTLMYITANGHALPCCIAPFAAPDYQTIMLGNILERPLEEVWNGPKYQELRGAVLSEAPAPWPCQHCGVKWSL